MTTATARKPTTAPTVRCHKCNGAGRIAAFSGIANGVCFACSGTGRISRRPMPADRFSPVDASHCETLEEACAYRLAEIDRRFPGVLPTLTDRAIWNLKNGCGRIEWWVRETK